MNLDNLSEIKALDSKKMLESISSLCGQVEQIYAEVKSLKLSEKYKKIANIVFFGMGGSALGAHCIKSLFNSEIDVPVEIVNGYNGPAYINKDSLVIIISYSGNTEETLAALKSARLKKTKIIVITSGGELQKISKKLKIPALIFDTKNNPCGSPRMGLGYTIFGPLFILKRLGLIKSSLPKINDISKIINKHQKLNDVQNEQSLNPAKQFAQNLSRGSVWFVSSEHLSGNVHIAANQVNENAKRFAGYFLIPELNHHLLEGLSFPKNELRTFVFIESKNFDKRILKRYQITKSLLEKYNCQFITYTCTETKPIYEMIEILVLSSYLSFYLAMIEGVDPTAIPAVDFLKAALK